MKLFWQALLKFLCGVVIVGVLLFLPAGTFDYWNAWLLMGILFVPMFFAGIVMMIKNPALLKKRLSAKEEQTEQKKRCCVRWLDVHAWLRHSRLELSVRMTHLSLLGIVGGRWSSPGQLPALCRSPKGEHLLIQDYRSAARSAGHRHRAVWHRSPSNVQRHHHPVLIHATGAGIFALLRHLPCIPRHHREATQK